MPGQFREVAQIDNPNVLELWGGADGTLPSLWLATGGRPDAGGGSSRMFRHDDAAGDAAWVDDGAPGGAETLNKIRDGNGTLYCFHETDGPWIDSRPAEGGGWSSMSTPEDDDFVGGRGLEVDGDTVWAGGSAEWNEGGRKGRLYKNTGGGFELQREMTPGLLWEIVRDAAGNIWEFWHEVGTTEAVAYLNGTAIEAPTSNVACAAEFDGEMYAGGNHMGGNTVWRWNGSGWGAVHTMGASSHIDHLVAIPREPPEFYVVGHDPFQVYKSLDGNSWEDQLLPTLPTGTDTNQLTALGYYNGRVWCASRDASIGRSRIYVDSAASQDLLLQVI